MQTFFGFCQQFGIEEKDRVAAFGLAAVHRGVGHLEQLVSAVMMFRKHRDTGGASDIEFVVLDHERSRQVTADFVRDRTRLLRAMLGVHRKIAQYDHELVAADTRHHVLFAQRAFDAGANVYQ